MSQSLTKIYVHIVFHVKSQSLTINPTHKHLLYSYIRTVISDRDSVPIEINGTADHIHILCLLSKNIALSKLVEDIKRHSSRWIKTLDGKYSKFAWQGGYAAFSVSQSVLEKTINYIKNQEEHHRKRSYKEEVMLFLKEYGMEYNEDYFFSD